MSKKKEPRNAIRLPRSVRRTFPNVKHAIDATKSVEVSVEAKDCKDGKRFNPSECALARAAKRELHADGVIIGMSSSYLIKGDTAMRFETPESVRREIVSFDRHQDFAPGDYYLTPKSPSTRFGITHSKRDREDTRTNKVVRRKVHKSARVRVLPKGSE
jgi:hypothetical protein